MADRYFVETPIDGPQARLIGTEAHHLIHVMRGKIGDQITLFDGLGAEYACRVSQVGRSEVTLNVGSRQEVNRESSLPLTLAVALPKGDRRRWLVEKAVELGVARLLPVVTQRTIVDRLNLERMRAHIVEAAEQCGRTSLAGIEEPVKLDALLKARDPARTLYFADETGGEPAASAFKPGPALILTGPEGGFTPGEATAIRATPNARAISLGPRILRAETAALAAVAAWMSAAGDWQ